METPVDPLHALLRRQLTRLGIPVAEGPPTPAVWQQLLARVSRSYAEADQERYTIERSLEISGRELRELNDSLRAASESQLAAEAGKLRTVVHAIGDGLCVLDGEGRIVFGNAACAQLLGCAVGAVADIPVLERLSCDGAPPVAVTALFARLRAECEIRWESAHLLRPGAAPLPVAGVLTVLGGGGDPNSGAVLVLRDRTQALQVHEQLVAAQETAEAGSRAKSKFLATMSHEIRTPMNGVLGMLHVLMQTELAPYQQDCVERALASGNALLTVIGDILDFSKIEAGKLAIESIPFDLDQALDEVVDLYIDNATAKGLTLQCEIAADVPTQVCGDPGRLRQIVTNFVSNGLKFTSAGGVRIRVCTVPGAASERLRIVVEDSGLGIAASKQRQLFQAFSQADASTTREYGGTGLGLAICRGLAEAMGGCVGVDSEPGRGSRFWIELALAVAQASPAPLGNVHIVLADAIEQELAARLRRLGASVHSVPWAAALDTLAAQPAAQRTLLLADDGSCPRRLDALAADPRLGDVRVLVARRGGPPLRDGLADHPRYQAFVRLPVRGAALTTSVLSCLPAVAPLPHRAGTVAATVELRKACVLVVEDNPVNQLVARRLLEKLGHEVLVVNSGAGAVAAVVDGRFDIVLMDCQMPEMDGYEATRRIRASESAGRRLPIIAMTANALQGDREQCLAAGMDDYLSKPVRPANLVAMLSTWLPRRA